MSTGEPGRNANSASLVYTALSPMYQPDIGEDGRTIGPPGRWPPAEASARINECAGRDDLDLYYALGIEVWMEENGVFTGDILHLLSTGYVYDDPSESSLSGYFKYIIEGPTPNSNGMTIAAMIIPNGGRKIKVAGISWKQSR